MANEFPGVPGDGGIFEHVADLYMPPVMSTIKGRASEFAEKDNRQEINAQDAFRALEEVFLNKYPLKRNGIISRWFASNFTGFIIIAALLTVAFGVLGIFGGVAAAPYIEVAKIFAGAVVGGAAGIATTRK